MDAIRRTPGRPASLPIALALKYMAEHLSEDIGRDEICRAAHLSPSHFSRLFAAHVGQSLKDYLTELRLNRARELLVRSAMPLAQVALESGFKDQSYFTKVFRQHLGATPGAYRSRRQNAAPN